MCEAEDDPACQFDDLIPVEQGYTLATGAPTPPTRDDLMRALMLIEIEEACAWKWADGKKEHRVTAAEGFQGDALVELHSEGIDALNYLQVLMDEGGHNHDCLEQLRVHALGIVRGARLLAQNGRDNSQ